MSSKDENEKKKEKEKYNENENEKKKENEKTLIIIKGLNDSLDEIIDKSKSFEEQIKSIKKIENLNEYYFKILKSLN